MKQAVIWSVVFSFVSAVFAFVAVLAFPFIAPLILRGEDMRQLGAAAFLPLIALGGALIALGGGAGFVFGLIRSHRKTG